MGALIFFLSPEIIVLALAALALLIFLLWHIRIFARSATGVVISLLEWAIEAGFVGFIAYIAAWVFMFPVMAVLCIGGGIVGT
jgi:hypothetical protein